MHSQSPQWTEHRFRVVTREALKIGIARPVIINPQSAPRVYILNAMAIPPKSANQFRHTLHGGSKRIDFGNLRSDMYADASNLEMPNPRCLRIQLARLVDWNSKLVLLQSGRNVRVRISGDIGIHSQCDSCLFPRPRGTLRQYPQLRFTLHVEQQNSRLESRRHLVGRLPYSGEDNFLSRAPVHAQNPLQFPARDHVEAAACSADQPQYAAVRICFYGVAAGMRNSAEAMLEHPQTPADG